MTFFQDAILDQNNVASLKIRRCHAIAHKRTVPASFSKKTKVVTNIAPERTTRGADAARGANHEHSTEKNTRPSK
jgi:hypothetical protein